MTVTVKSLLSDTTMESSRLLVPYDDIILPYDTSEGSRTAHISKKRKIRNTKTKSQVANIASKSNQLESQQSTMVASRDKTNSRELSHAEIWDDSALREAWNAATEEYEVSLNLAVRYV